MDIIVETVDTNQVKFEFVVNQASEENEAATEDKSNVPGSSTALNLENKTEEVSNEVLTEKIEEKSLLKDQEVQKDVVEKESK